MLAGYSPHLRFTIGKGRFAFAVEWWEDAGFV